MFNRTHLFIIVLAILAGAAGFAAQIYLGKKNVPTTSKQRSLGIGDPAEDITLINLQGQTQTLSSLPPRPVLLNFWASWCSPCIQEMPLLDAYALEQGEQGVQVIGIALDEAKNVRSFLTDHPVSYPIWLDTPGRNDSSVIYGNTKGALPYSVLIGANRRIVAQKWGAFEDQTLKTWIDQNLP
jgi:thiol-disulfide isomerase/thioredoxin